MMQFYRTILSTSTSFFATTTGTTSTSLLVSPYISTSCSRSCCWSQLFLDSSSVASLARPHNTFRPRVSRSISNSIVTTTTTIHKMIPPSTSVGVGESGTTDLHPTTGTTTTGTTTTGTNSTTTTATTASTIAAIQSAHHYSDHVTRFTKPHAMDLMELIIHPEDDRISTAQNILDIGCGTGIFALMYLQRFPHGIPGQTIYCTDLNPAMVQVTQRVVTEQLQQLQSQLPETNGCATKFVFQVADGTKLDMFPDHMFDLIVSVFGLFLIPDRTTALQEVRRVLQVGGTLAMTAWTTTGSNEALRSAGFGANLHEAMSLMRLPNATTTTTTSKMASTTSPTASSTTTTTTEPTTTSTDTTTTKVPPPPLAQPPQSFLPPHIIDWFEPQHVKEMLMEHSMFQNVVVHRVIHSVGVPNVERMWHTFSNHKPTSHTSTDVDTTPEEEDKERAVRIDQAKMILGQYIAMEGNIHHPLFIRTVSNLIVAQ